MKLAWHTLRRNYDNIAK